MSCSFTERLRTVRVGPKSFQSSKHAGFTLSPFKIGSRFEVSFRAYSGCPGARKTQGIALLVQTLIHNVDRAALRTYTFVVGSTYVHQRVQAHPLPSAIQVYSRKAFPRLKEDRR